MNLSSTLRALLALIAGLLILTLLNWNIFQREHLTRQGRVVLLQLAPVDPRSLMQGDYMALHFALADEISHALGDKQPEYEDEDAKAGADGAAILKLDANNIAHLARLDDGAPLQPDEVRLRYRVRNGYFNRIKLATNAFFFEEGQRDAYAKARYGEFRVAENGDAVLVQMRDEKLNVLRPLPAAGAAQGSAE
jgi:uncharacterized membrane-anchored protein